VDYLLIWKHLLNSCVTHYCGAPTVQVYHLAQSLLKQCLTYMDKDRDNKPSQRKAAPTPSQDDNRRCSADRSIALPVRIQRFPACPRLRPDVRRCPVLTISEWAQKTAARRMGPSPAIILNLLGPHCPPPSGPNFLLGRVMPLRPRFHSVSFAPQNLPAKSS